MERPRGGRDATIAIAPMPIAIATSVLDAGSVNAGYSAMLSAAGGTGTTNWSIVSGTLPSGLTLSALGAITGTPTTAGTSTFTVQASDAGWSGNNAVQALSIAIAADVAAFPSPVGAPGYRQRRFGRQCAVSRTARSP